MKRLSTLFFSLVLSTVLMAQSNAPRLVAVTPETGKPTAEYSTTGDTLAKATVKELYLTNGKDDIKVTIVTQQDASILFKVPTTTKPGRYSLMLLTADGKMFLEQPVKLTIE